ncbi:MAG: GAF domain-containing protein [Anaerolineales bacterium]|nr:GAF domain-containing protein [Anaerolineales bacterium]
MNQEINQTSPPQPSQMETGTDDLLRKIIDYFKAPVFEDDSEKTRKSSILNSLLLTLFLVINIYIILIFFTIENPIRSLIIVSLIQLLIVGNFIAIRRGAVETATIVFVVSMWLLIMAAGVMFGQAAYNPILPILLLVLSVAGTILDSRVSISIGILSLVYLVGFYIVGQQVELPQILENSEVVSVSRLAMGIIFATFLTAVSYGANRRSIRQIEEADDALRESNKELQEIRSYLEEEVAENTKQLERRSRYLEAGAKVAGATISTQNLETMLEAVVNEVGSQFGFYHVGIFMLDEEKKWAVLRSASSEGGKRMIARNHRLAVGRQGIVGFVTSLGQGRISQDIGDDRVHTPAEELPETRSEMALPLTVRGEIIGAIDIQDTKPEAFTEDDITVLQTMADQIALAIENIRLFSQTQETLEEVQRLYGEYSQQAWHEAHQRNLLSSYRYFSGNVTRLDKSDPLRVSEDTVSIPVEVRGVHLGEIKISKGEENAQWTDEELKLLNSLSEQLGIALDSARLFNESQLRATTEHTISAINSQLWETMDINSILRTTAQNLRESLALPELTIRMASPEVELEASSNGNPDQAQSEVNH